MATKVILPKLGQTMEEGTIIEWLKNEGDPVSRGDILFQLETDKAVLEVEARTKGVLRKIVVGTGIKIPVMTVVGVIAAADEEIGDLLAELDAGASASDLDVAEPAASAPSPPLEAAPGAMSAPVPISRPGGRIFSSPRARKLAREKGADLVYISGSGPRGRIIERDVQAFLERQPAATPMARKVAKEMGIPLEQVPTTGQRVTAAQVRAAGMLPAQAPLADSTAGEIVPMTGLRGIIADRMGTSAQTTAAVTLQSVVDATEFVALRTRLKDALADELGFNVGFNDLLAVIVARCLVEFPYMNARLVAGTGSAADSILRLERVSLGMAVDSERGLLVPVIHNAHKMGLKELARTFRDMVGRARAGKSLPDELTGGTLTITNLGMFGVDSFTPIINLPECAILGVGRIRPEPAVVDGQITVRQHLWLSLTFDHRVVDGAPAARFLQAIARYIEAPYLLLA